MPFLVAAGNQKIVAWSGSKLFVCDTAIVRISRPGVLGSGDQLTDPGQAARLSPQFLTGSDLSEFP